MLAYSEQPQETLEEIAFIAAERPLQLRAARNAALEIAIQDMEGRLAITQIAGAAHRLNEILPPETKLSDPRWGSALGKLGNASREAMRSLQPIGRQARLKAIDRMVEELHKIRPNFAFRDQSINGRVRHIIEGWEAAAQAERERLEQLGQDIGHIDNPYKPGQVLEPHDSLFVGRRDLALQLEYALNKGSRRPTLLLQGERRMGKTSTLRQLAYVLGASYIPVIYNLQNPQIYARTAIFLGTIADGIHDELIQRGIKIERMAFERIRSSGAINDPMAYSFFERWLRKVESLLEEGDCTLLLAFDEFEKLDENAQKGDLDLPLFLDWCRGVIQYRPRIALLFSGVHTFGDMGRKTGINWSNYFVNVQTLKVSFLNPDEARQLILHPRTDYPGEKIFGLAAEQVIQQTNGHPFLVQALCSQLIDDLNVDKAEQVENGSVARAIEQLVEAWDGYFDDLWKRCDGVERACLVYLCDQQQAVDHDDIEGGIKREKKDIGRALRMLVRRDLIVMELGAYRIAAPILRLWVQHNA
ncbi:hypothetical protein KDK_13530 [Dictyobacter kobayashii]|uniref:Uncharacterized protein n=1 Tax=Dictyobacter kobayashii TaxID=2014872 RepID=A0A402AEP2_9CHLR|nr:hypothetical protein KDK_13530 [Dictyobacter kobayashii]